MRTIVGRLVSDSWVLAIATAIAVGYAAVRVVSELVELVLAVIDGDETAGRFVVEIKGHDIPYFDLLAATVTFTAVALLGAWLLARADRT